MGDSNKTGFALTIEMAWSGHSEWPGNKSKSFEKIMYIFTEDFLQGLQREITQHRTE